MLPTWVGVVSAISLVIIALAAIVVAVASVASALGIRAFTKALEQLAGPTIQDVRQLIGTIKGEADALVGTSRDIRERILRAADAAEHRLTDLDALVEVVQDEVEGTVLDAAATLRNVRRGLSLWQWGRKVFKGKKKKRK
jgi:membrane protein implicated in regulation of membrane protease activity